MTKLIPIVNIHNGTSQLLILDPSPLPFQLSQSWQPQKTVPEIKCKCCSQKCNNPPPYIFYLFHSTIFSQLLFKAFQLYPKIFKNFDKSSLKNDTNSRYSLWNYKAVSLKSFSISCSYFLIVTPAKMAPEIKCKCCSQKCNNPSLRFFIYSTCHFSEFFSSIFNNFKCVIKFSKNFKKFSLKNMYQQ